MPPRKKTPPGPPSLTDADVADLAFRVKGGDTPRVVVRSGSAALPAGTRGNVIRIGKPSEGEYIVVRLGRDEVPFAPSELSLPTRGRGATAVSGAATKRTAAAATRPSTKTAATKSPATRATPSRPAPSKSASKSAATGRGATKAARSPAAAKVAPAASSAAGSAKRTAKRAGPRGKGRSPQPLTVTLRFSDSRWTVEAQRGSRRITKAIPLRPGAVSAFAEHVEEQAVREALVETVESCRSVVEEKAALLRAELLAAEAALKEYDARRR